MFQKIELTDPFKHKDFTYDFQKGLTAISGPNGAGKTLITEMLEFALWGSEALRGPASDYSKGLKVRVYVEIKGVSYMIDRTGTTAELYDPEGKEVAAGVKFVNAKIKELMGYSYDVFRVTNVARQGEIERMGQMKPTERKQLVDETIGLSRIEALGEWIYKQQALASGKLGVLNDMLVPPGPEPEPFPHERNVTKEQVQELQAQRATWAAHRGYLGAPEPVSPHERDSEYDWLVAQQQARVQAQARIQGLDSALKGFPTLGPRPAVPLAALKLAELEKETARYKELKGNIRTLQQVSKNYPEPSTYTNEQLDKAQGELNQHALWVKKQELVGKMVKHQCPKCEHIWHDKDARLQDYENITSDVVPSMSVTELSYQRKINDYQDTRASILLGLSVATQEFEQLKDHTELISTVKKAQEELRAYLQREERETQRLSLEAERNGVDVPADVSAVISEIIAANARVQAYNTALLRHQEAKLAVHGIPSDIDDKTAAAELNYSEYQTYLNEVAFREKARIQYEAALRNIEAQKLVVQDWKSAREAVALLRSRIKGYLLPSLNDVASKILANMSNQWLNWVVVNEDFDINVEGKSIKVLSGAGKALTNLALRIGLGQVLTNSVFPVLILDEADAGVDKEKAPMVAQALRRLTGTIAQIIVISHKAGIEADHHLELS